MLSTEIWERNINDKDEMPGYRGNENDRKVDSTEKMMKIKGTFLKI